MLIDSSNKEINLAFREMIQIINKNNFLDGVFKSKHIEEETNNLENFPNLKRIKNKYDFEFRLFGGFPTLNIIYSGTDK